MPQRLPTLAYVLGAAGLLPMLLCAAAAISAGPERVLGMQALVAYAAVILSFLGAVHWGLAIATATTTARHQLSLSTVPALLGWAALLLLLLSWETASVLLTTEVEVPHAGLP